MTQDNRPGHFPQTEADKFAKLRGLLTEPAATDAPASEKSDETPSVLYVSGNNNNIALHGFMRQNGVNILKIRDFAVIIATLLFFSQHPPVKRLALLPHHPKVVYSTIG